MQNSCPHCSSANTVRLAVAYQTGTSTGMFAGLGADGGNTIGLGGLTSKQTLFAQQAAPPKQPPSSLPGRVTLAIGLIAILLPWAYGFNPAMSYITWGIGVVMLIISAIILIEDHRGKKQLHEYLLVQWARQWVCLQCGARFEPKKLDFSEESA